MEQVFEPAKERPYFDIARDFSPEESLLKVVAAPNFCIHDRKRESKRKSRGCLRLFHEYDSDNNPASLSSAIHRRTIHFRAPGHGRTV